MSIVTEIRTQNRLHNLLPALETVAEMGYNIVANETEWGYKLHLQDLSIREVEISVEEYGYSVRLTVLACSEEFELYRDIVKTLHELTKGKLFFEGDTPFQDADVFFNDDFIDAQIESDFRTIMTVAENGEEIEIFCPHRTFIIGKRVAETINKHSDLNTRLQTLWSLIRLSQYTEPVELNSPLFRINGDKICTIYRQNNHGYIRKADYFALQDGENMLSIPYTKLNDVKPDSWYMYDECQFGCMDIDDSEWTAFWNRAKSHEVEMK
ncbi:MAG: hypothetical protein JKX84_11440 [Flavobacteriales bacterium]|nr:hypothetical protein [Flavobacteriales bacterium]